MRSVNNTEFSAVLLHDPARYAILKTQKEQPPQSGWPHEVNSNIEITTSSLAKVSGVVFLCSKHYLINVKTNVSNARMNIPKAIRSLKSKGFLSISTTPILCRIEVSHPVTRLFLSLSYHNGSRQATICSLSF